MSISFPHRKRFLCSVTTDGTGTDTGAINVYYSGVGTLHQSWLYDKAHRSPPHRPVPCPAGSPAGIPLRAPLGTLLAVLLGALPAALPASARAQQASAPHENIEWLDITVPDANVTLPRVLLIGDSIVRLYYPTVQAALKGRAAVGRLSTSKCAGDPQLIREVEGLLQQYRFDVIQFNNGMHGSGFDAQTYDAGLATLMASIRKAQPQARLLWASTTPVRRKNDLAHLDPEANARVVERNRRAAARMKAAGIETDDLYTLMLPLPDNYVPDGIHAASWRLLSEWQRMNPPAQLACTTVVMMRSHSMRLSGLGFEPGQRQFSMGKLEITLFKVFSL